MAADFNLCFITRQTSFPSLNKSTRPFERKPNILCPTRRPDIFIGHEKIKEIGFPVSSPGQHKVAIKIDLGDIKNPVFVRITLKICLRIVGCGFEESEYTGRQIFAEARIDKSGVHVFERIYPNLFRAESPAKIFRGIADVNVEIWNLKN